MPAAINDQVSIPVFHNFISDTATEH